MKKFELKCESIEIKYKDRQSIKKGCTQNQDDLDPEMIGSFRAEKEALEELKKYTTSISELSGAGGVYYLVKEYYIEENDYDEDGDLEEVGDILAFSPIRIEVISEQEYATVGVFDRFSDAEKCADELEDGFMSFKHGGQTWKKQNLKVALFNNGTGLLINGGYAHFYDDMAQMANDIKAIQAGDDCTDWDNNEIEHVSDKYFDLNGDTYVIDDLSDIDTNWGANADGLAAALKEI